MSFLPAYLSILASVLPAISCLTMYPCICPSMYLSFRLPIRLLDNVTIYWSVSLVSLSFLVAVQLYIWLFNHLSVWLSNIYLSIPPTDRLSTYPWVCLSIFPSDGLIIYQSTSQSVSLSVSLTIKLSICYPSISPSTVCLSFVFSVFSSVLLSACLSVSLIT